MRRKSGKGNGFVDPPFLIEDRLAKSIEPEPASSLPVDRFGNTALLTFDHLLEAGEAVRNGMFPHFNADVSTSHFVRHGAGGPRTEEGVENEITGIGGYCDNSI